MNKLRRNIVLGSAAALTGGYAMHRGLRYPPLSFEPSALASDVVLAQARLQLQDLLVNPKQTNVLRAVTPEPALTMLAEKGKHQFTINNISPSAKLKIDSPSNLSIEQERQGLARNLTINTKQLSEINLSWKLDSQAKYKFAVIGDTGAGHELDWALQRAHQLDALFLLHLGDFNYAPGEYAKAIEKFNSSPLPVYVTIGNHDFHDDGLIYDRFRAEIGPMNHAFSLAGTQFVNIDTAADFFPASSGLRGQLFSNLASDQSKYSDRVFFTHRPLRDPRPYDDHEIGGIGEIAWLHERMAALGVNTILTGHVHHSAELDYNGIKQWTIGEGLGHENIVLQRPVAQMLVGELSPYEKTKFQWVDLNLPWLMHTSPTHRIKLIKDARHRQLDWYEGMINATEKAPKFT